MDVERFNLTNTNTNALSLSISVTLAPACDLTEAREVTGGWPRCLSVVSLSPLQHPSHSLTSPHCSVSRGLQTTQIYQ